MAKNKKAQILAAVMCATTVVGFSPAISSANVPVGDTITVGGVEIKANDVYLSVGPNDHFKLYNDGGFSVGGLNFNQEGTIRTTNLFGETVSYDLNNTLINTEGITRTKQGRYESNAIYTTSIEGNTFNSNGAIENARGNFKVGQDGTISAANGKFAVGQGGSVSGANGKGYIRDTENGGTISSEGDVRTTDH